MLGFAGRSVTEGAQIVVPQALVHPIDERSAECAHHAYAVWMGRFLPLMIVALLTIYCVVEVAQAQPYAVRRAPRWLWATAIICMPLIGAVSWLFLGRPTAATRNPQTRRRHPIAPDDDVDFLRGL
jgi:Phospholipase_D-nuclease N-terminal